MISTNLNFDDLFKEIIDIVENEEEREKVIQLLKKLMHDIPEENEQEPLEVSVNKEIKRSYLKVMINQVEQSTGSNPNLSIFRNPPPPPPSLLTIESISKFADEISKEELRTRLRNVESFLRFIEENFKEKDIKWVKEKVSKLGMPILIILSKKLSPDITPSPYLFGVKVKYSSISESPMIISWTKELEHYEPAELPVFNEIKKRNVLLAISTSRFSLSIITRRLFKRKEST